MAEASVISARQEVFEYSERARNERIARMGTGEGLRRGWGGDPHKREQLEIIKRTNPMADDYHTGIRTIDDIKTWGEAVDEAKKNALEGEWEEWSSYPDVSNDMIEKAIRSGKITVYSSHPIEDGTFVSPSRMMAKDYAGSGTVYSKEVNLNDVAWINTDEGQLARVKRR